MAYVPLVESPGGSVARSATRYGRRRFGRVVEPVAVAALPPGDLVARPVRDGRLDPAAPVTEDGIERLHQDFSDPQIVELASWVAPESYLSRFTTGLRPRPQGLSATRRAPPAIAREDPSETPSP
jgi:hypothetical protein